MQSSAHQPLPPTAAAACSPFLRPRRAQLVQAVLEKVPHAFVSVEHVAKRVSRDVPDIGVHAVSEYSGLILAARLDECRLAKVTTRWVRRDDFLSTSLKSLTIVSSSAQLDASKVLK